MPDADDFSGGADDKRYEFLLTEAIRGLQRQEGALDNARARSATILATAALAASFLGAATYGRPNLSPGATGAVVVAVAALGLVLACVIFIMLPRKWDFAVSTTALIRDYVEAEQPATLTEMRRDVALHLEAAYDTNAKMLEVLWLALQVASVAVVVEVFAWVAALAVR